MQVIQRIEERIARISFLPVENGEGLQVLRYEVRCCTQVYTVELHHPRLWFAC